MIEAPKIVQIQNAPRFMIVSNSSVSSGEDMFASSVWEESEQGEPSVQV